MSDHGWEKDTSIDKERGDTGEEVAPAETIVDSTLARMPGAGLGDPGYVGYPDEEDPERDRR